MSAHHFFVLGEPKGQPRPRAFARKMGDKFVARVYDAGTAEAWKSCVAAAAGRAIVTVVEGNPEGLSVRLSFYFRRPKGHYRTGAHANQLRESAPVYHTAKPDADNAAKAVLDALVTIGAIPDDAAVFDLRVMKRYVDSQHPNSGCMVSLESANHLSNTCEQCCDGPPACTCGCHSFPMKEEKQDRETGYGDNTDAVQGKQREETGTPLAEWTDEDLRMKCAELCGWIFQGERMYRPWKNPRMPLRRRYLVHLPDYPRSLEAMHTAEMTLSGEQCEVYFDHLNEPVDDDGDYPAQNYIMHATARKRCIAFIRTLSEPGSEVPA